MITDFIDPLVLAEGIGEIVRSDPLPFCDGPSSEGWSEMEQRLYFRLERIESCFYCQSWFASWLKDRS